MHLTVALRERDCYILGGKCTNECRPKYVIPNTNCITVCCKITLNKNKPNKLSIQ
ncbi:hypothetical protein FQR65_LT02243 [Abscondita terminalis]|nr:hypothetical protein FQR65_LT02243 [Abscondita terminalis]